MSHDHDCENINAPVGMEGHCGCEDRRRAAEDAKYCCEKYDSCTRDCIPRLHWHDERRTLRPEARAIELLRRARHAADFGYHGKRPGAAPCKDCALADEIDAFLSCTPQRDAEGKP